MKTRSPYVASTATLLLHIALAAAVVTWQSVAKQQITRPVPLTVQLGPPAILAPAPVEPTPSPPPQPPEKKPSTSTPYTKHTEVVRPAPAPSQQAREPQTPPVSTSTPSVTSLVEATPAATAQPVKTDVFINPSYLAAETEKWYPRLARQYGDEGRVVLKVTVSPTGRIEKVKLKEESGNPLLDEAAVSNVRSLIFQPATSNGVPVSTTIDLPIEFKLKN